MSPIKIIMTLIRTVYQLVKVENCFKILFV